MRRRRTSLLRLLTWAFLIFFAPVAAYADTPVSGVISTDTTWTLAGSPYIVVGTVEVYRQTPPVPTLTIEPGVVVKFNPSTRLDVGWRPGGLVAVGTASQPITFTANSENPTPGSWDSIQFLASTTPSSRIAHASLRYAVTGISIGSSPTIENTTIRNCSQDGVSIAGSPSLQTVTISDNGGFPISTWPAVTLNVSGLTVSGNGTDAVRILGGSVWRNTTWKNIGLNYVIAGAVRVRESTPPAPVLTIEPGVNLRFSSAASLSVGDTTFAPGGLQAVGTATQPITFTANSASPAPGFWGGIHFGPSTLSTSRLAHASLAYGGISFSATCCGAIHIDGSSPRIENVTVQNNIHSAVSATGTALPLITSSTLSSSPVGLVASFPASPSLQAVTISNNTGFAISVDPKVTLGTVSGLTVTGNGTDAVQIRASAVGVDANTTWKAVGVPYVATDNIPVQKAGGPTPVLTIEPGITVRFNQNKYLRVGQNYPGEFQASGTATQPITFTANASMPGPGYWTGVQFFPGTTSASRVAYATVSYAGYPAGGARVEGGIHIQGSSPTVQNVTVQNNTQAGITVLTTGPAASPSLLNVSILNNLGYAMIVDATVTLGTVSGLTATGNTPDAIEIRSSQVDTTTTLKNVGLPYVTRHLIVGKPTAPVPVLTIEPGVTLRFVNGGRFSVGEAGYGAGELQAVGTAAQPITFTANSATPSPGQWYGILLRPGTAAGSRIVHAIVRYGGNAEWFIEYGGLHIENCSPTIENSTFQNNAFAGISVRGGSAIAASSLTNLTISNNPDYAMSVDADVTLGTVSSLTVGGNGTNGILLRPAAVPSVTRNTTWKNAGVPYVVRFGIGVGSSVAPRPVLTIEPGVTIRFNSGTGLGTVATAFPGELQAVGTPAQPITFTANLDMPPPGFWGGISFANAAPSSSRIAYASVSYATYGIFVSSRAAPVFDHVTFNANSNAAVGVGPDGSPTVENCNFVNNAAGIINFTPATSVTARLNWWNASSGPSGAGPGTGQSVTAGVAFEPWLTSAATAPHFINTFSHTNPTFNPAQSIFTTTAFTTTLAGTWTATIRNSAQQLIRQFTGLGTSAAPTWDGRDSADAPAPDGAYSYLLESTAGSDVAASATGRAVLDRTRPLALTNVAVDNPYFSPNGDSVKETARMSGDANYTVNWTVEIKDSGGATVRTLTGSGTSVSAVWDGRDGSDTLQPEAAYSMNASATAGTATVTAVRSTILDVTFPVSLITDPAASSIVSNVYRSGVTNIPVIGSGTDLNLENWILDFGEGGSPTFWATLRTGTTPVSEAELGIWPTLSLTNGLYSLRLRVLDRAGNLRTAANTTTLGNFKVSQNTLQVNRAASGTVVYSSVVPFTLTETLLVKDAAGTTRRTLANEVSRPAGTYADSWDGRDDASNVLRDGPYFYVATVTDGTNSLTWDLTNEYRNDYNDETTSATEPAFDPFNNAPLTFTYNFREAGRVTLAISRDGGANCAPPHICLLTDKYEESGPHTIRWAGVGPDGAYRGDLSGIIGVSNRASFSKNAVVLYGTRPAVSNLRVTPPYYGPALGNQTVSFNLATFQNQPADITISFLNQASLSTLRTVSLSGQAPGSISIPWDGRADNGMWVAPGLYTVTVTVTDSLGNEVKEQILTTIAY